MATALTTPPKPSATEVVRAMRERNAARRARVEQRLASLRRTADALRAQQR